MTSLGLRFGCIALIAPGGHARGKFANPLHKVSVLGTFCTVDGLQSRLHLFVLVCLVALFQ